MKYFERVIKTEVSPVILLTKRNEYHVGVSLAISKECISEKFLWTYYVFLNGKITDFEKDNFNWFNFVL